MRPLVSSVTVDMPREQVFDFLDVLANHEAFTDHYLVDWTVGGPESGVGATARLRPSLPGPAVWMEMRVVDSQAPARIVEESTSAGGRRLSRGSFLLTETGGRTTVKFSFEQVRLLPLDRLFAPLMRRWLQRGNDRAMRRLAEITRSTSRSG
jgi:hypothetical protein